MLAARREVETTMGMNAELMDCSIDDIEMIYAAIESSAAGMGRRPSEWPQHLEMIQERTHITEQCHYFYFLRGTPGHLRHYGGTRQRRSTRGAVL